MEETGISQIITQTNIKPDRIKCYKGGAHGAVRTYAGRISLGQGQETAHELRSEIRYEFISPQ